MTNYSRNYDFSVKDALASGDPDKLIVGAEVDSELDEIATCIATKYDSSDLATQAQAEAEASNAVLLTPLRLAQWADYNAGMVGDIQALTDPNGDRILFWDDSAGAAAFLTAGTGLSISGTTLAIDTTTVDHDTLLNYVADQHVAHSSVSISAGEGLTGGGTIAASRSLALNINGLTNETTYDYDNDTLAFYDASAAAHRKTPLGNFIGTALGDGRWNRSTAITMSSTPTTLASLTEVYDELTRGTFSAAAGTYTAGAAACRIMLAFHITTTSGVGSGKQAYAEVQVDGTAVAKFGHGAAGGGEEGTLQGSVCLSLTTGQVVRVQYYMGSSTADFGGDATLVGMSIQELA